MISASVLFLAAVLAGAVAAVSGFGIGSLLTPLLAASIGTKAAVAVVSIPHFIATGARFLSLKEHVDKRVFWRFGLMSAAGGLLGALLNSRANNPILALVFGSLLIFVALAQFTGLSERMRFGKKTAWVAGFASGTLGGLVGNQGGIRAAALLGFAISKESFVATATAIGLVVDAARMPVYFGVELHDLIASRTVIIVACIGVLLGTFGGVHLLRRLPDVVFRNVLSTTLLLLGIYMFAQGIR
jgi:hypothetical protein